MSTATEHDLVDQLLQKLYPILGGHIYFQTLSAAVRFDLFGLLKKHGELDLARVARHLGIAPKPARILLLGCAALGLVSKNGPMYANSELADRLLVRDAPNNLIPVIRWQEAINYRAMAWFYEALQSNTNVGLREFPGDEPTLYQRLVHQPKLERIFQDAMEGISVHANAMLAEYVDFSMTRHLVDIGGGNGSNILALCRHYPDLRATVFDSPSVCRIAQAKIARADLADRADAVPGNCFHDEFPRDADCLLLAHFLTIWSEDENATLLKKCYRALPSGGTVVVFNMMQSDDEDGPLSAAMGSPYFLTLATGGGMLYTWNEYETWIREAGFSEVQRIVLPRDHGVLIGRKEVNGT